MSLRFEGRFVVDAHVHITTLYKPRGMKEGWDFPEGWTGLHGEVEPFDNSAFTLYEMERYGIDMCILKPSVIGTTNEMQAMLVDRYPDKFRAFCSDQKLKIRVARGEAEWTLEAALEEVEAALKTGKFVGIGEFVPSNPDPKHVYTFRERLDEFRAFCDLAAKYGVAIDFHEFIRNDGWDPYQLLQRLAMEYPDVPIIFCHSGYSIGCYPEGAALIRKAVRVAGMASFKNGIGNIYLETGNWPAEYYKYALRDPNVGPTQLLWTGADYGNVPQYITAHPGEDPPTYTTSMRRWPPVPSYQPDYWGWALHQIHRLKDFNWVTQDEINLILGGNAARIFKLPVPFERMFPEGRPDLYGIYWKQSRPYIPKEQVKHPDYPTE